MLVAFLYANATSQCTSTGFANASSFSTDNSIGVYNFSNPSNAQFSNNTRAVASSVIGILSGNTYYLKATGFNFSIPDYTSICGISLQVECRATNLLLTAAVRDNDVRLVKNGVLSGDNYANAVNWGTTDSYSTYGGSCNLWGTTLTPSDVNDPGFGIAFSARIIALIAALPTVEIDHIRLEVHFNTALPVKLSNFNASRSGNAVALCWKTDEEETGSSIILQRSTDNFNWDTLIRYELDFTTESKNYKFIDQPQSSGNYYYRLKTILATGKVDYSSIKMVSITDKKTLSTFPNPSVDYITVNNPSPVITDMFGKQWKLVVEKADNLSSRINVTSLPKGLYIVHANGETCRFIKQ